MFTTGTVQDFDPAFHTANRYIAGTCDVVAGRRDTKGVLHLMTYGKENEAAGEEEGQDGSDECIELPD